MGLSSYGKSNKDLPNFFNDGFPHGLKMGNRELILPTYPNAAAINPDTISEPKKPNFGTLKIRLKHANAPAAIKPAAPNANCPV